MLPQSLPPTAHYSVPIQYSSPSSFHPSGFQFWPAIPATGINIANYEEQSRLAYYPELRNIALLAMFGFIELTTVKPGKDKGWRIKFVEKLPFGDAMMTLLYGVFRSVQMWWPSDDDPELPFAELQPTLQPYFPEWQNTLLGNAWLFLLLWMPATVCVCCCCASVFLRVRMCVCA